MGAREAAIMLDESFQRNLTILLQQSGYKGALPERVTLSVLDLRDMLRATSKNAAAALQAAEVLK